MAYTLQHAWNIGILHHSQQFSEFFVQASTTSAHISSFTNWRRRAMNPATVGAASEVPGPLQKIAGARKSNSLPELLEGCC